MIILIPRYLLYRPKDFLDPELKPFAQYVGIVSLSCELWNGINFISHTYVDVKPMSPFSIKYKSRDSLDLRMYLVENAINLYVDSALLTPSPIPHCCNFAIGVIYFV